MRPLHAERCALRARPGATRAMAIALLAVVALAGVGLGFAADRVALHSRRGEGGRRYAAGFGPAPEGRHGRGGDAKRGDEIRDRFERELDLTPDQSRRFDSIMTQQMVGFRRLRQEMQPRFDSLLAQAQSGIDAVLTPAQREKLKALRAREAFGPRDAFGGRERRPPPIP